MVIMLLPPKPTQHLKETCLTSLSRNCFPRIPSLVESHPSWQNRNSNKHLCLLAWKVKVGLFLMCFFHLLQNKSTSFLRFLLFLIIRNRRILSISMFLLYCLELGENTTERKKTTESTRSNTSSKRSLNIPPTCKQHPTQVTNKPTATVGFTTSWGLDA